MGQDSSKLTRTRKQPRKPPEGYIVAQDAASKLGLSLSQFYFYVSKGLIPKKTQSGGREGYFLHELIQEFAPLFRKRKEKKISYAEMRSQMVLIRDRVFPSPLGRTDWISFDDLPFVQKLDIALYGIEDTVDMAITWGWWQANPRMCRILFNSEDRQDVWGALTAIPMREETIYKLLRHEMAERDIKPDDILVYEPGQSYSCYVPSLAIRPEHKTHLRVLIQSFFDYWCDLAPDITITRLYAYPTSEQGMSVIHHLFFSPRYDLSENAFELVPLRPGNPSILVKSFQSCIEKKKQAHE
jgi:predicted DNA-binding transcriptional regulator AlpA